MGLAVTQELTPRGFKSLRLHHHTTTTSVCLSGRKGQPAKLDARGSNPLTDSTAKWPMRS